RPLAEVGPDLGAPALDGRLIALDGPPDRDLGRPAEFLEQAADVILVVADAELLFDDEGDSGAGPYLAAEAVSLRAMPEELQDEALLFGGQAGDTARGRAGTKGLDSVAFGDGEPAADSGARDAERLGDRPLGPALVPQLHRPHPPPFLPIPEVRESVLHTPFYGPEKLTSLRSD